MSARQPSHCVEGKKKSFVVVALRQPSTVSTSSSFVRSLLLPALSRCHRLSLLLLPAGSAMAGLDGLIGAEERVINSKAKISNNVVRALRRFAPPESLSNHLWTERSIVKSKGTGTKLFSETSSTVVLTRLPHVDDTYNQRFNTAAPVQLFNQTDLSANYVVIVTTVSRCAICVCVSGLCQSLSLTLNRLCILFCSHGMPLFFFVVVVFFPTRLTIPRHLNATWLLNVCRVSHFNLWKKTVCLCVWICKLFFFFFFSFECMHVFLSGGALWVS